MITGGGGLVGRALTEHCRTCGDDVLSYDHSTLDIADSSQVDEFIARELPQAVINCAAWTDVDGCESDPKRAIDVNALGPENLARASRRTGAALLTISTDYVFDGKKEGFYTQRDNPAPESVYGSSKLEGERRSAQEHARTIIVRTGFIFGQGGTNFLSTLIDRAKRGEELKVIDDAWGTPTYSRHLASRLRELVILDIPGLFQVVNSGEGATFEEFSRLALDLAGIGKVPLKTLHMDSLNRPAPRPHNSRLRCLLSEAMGLEPLPLWKDGLRQFIAESQG